MAFQPKARLRNRILSVSLIVTVSTALVLGAVVFISTNSILRENYLRSQLAVVHAMSDSIEMPDSPNGNATWDESSVFKLQGQWKKVMERDPTVLSVSLIHRVDSIFRVVASSKQDYAPGSLLDRDKTDQDRLRNVLEMGSDFVSEKYNDANVPMFEIFTSVGNAPNKPIGALILETSEKSILESQVFLLMIVGTVFLLVFLGSLIGGLVLSRSIVQPIQDLHAMVDSVEQGNLNPTIPHLRKDEFGQLFVGFQKMLESLKSYIREHEHMQEQLRHQTYHDELTSLPNKKAFLERLGASLHQTIRSGEDTYRALLLMDLDNFKLLNDSLGHQLADQVFLMVCSRIRGQLRQTDEVFRLDGDVFGVILNVLTKEEDAALVAQKILRAIESPFRVTTHIVHLSISIGIALLPSDGNTVPTLIKNAHTALAEAKVQKSCYRFFTVDMQERAHDRLIMINDLHRAVQDNEFLPYFQVQVDRDGRYIGAEVLLRWKTPDGSLISPLKFIPIAEETNLIVPIGKLVIEATCSVIQRLEAAGWNNIPLSLNLSGKQLMNTNIATLLEEMMVTYGLKPQNLHLEITESVLSEENKALVQIDTLHNQGYRIMVDDFGTGYSSLSRLKKLPVDVLKVDKSFVDGLPDDHTDRDLVNAIITLAHDIGLRVIAEGVETQAQLECLKELGCDAFQGYFFSKPVPEDQFVELIKKSKKTNLTLFDTVDRTNGKKES